MGFKVAPSESTITQPTNYEIKTDQGKPRLSLVPINGIWTAIAKIREYGVKKYTDTESWKQVEIQILGCSFETYSSMHCGHGCSG